MPHVIVNEATVKAALDALGEPRLDTRISLEATGGPEFGNVEMFSSTAQRKSIELWPRDLRSWSVSFIVRWDSKTPDTSQSLQLFRKLLGFFRLRRGNSRPFRFKDWTDYEDDGNGYVVYRNGVYRLVKRHEDEFTEELYDMPIFKPVPSTVTLVGCTGNIDYKTGIVANCSGPGKWTGHYDLWVSFSDAKLQYRAMAGGVLNWNGINVREEMIDETVIAGG